MRLLGPGGQAIQASEDWAKDFVERNSPLFISVQTFYCFPMLVLSGEMVCEPIFRAREEIDLYLLEHVNDEVRYHLRGKT